MRGALSQDEFWMRHAIRLAEKAWGETHPNPMVGSVLVDEKGAILSEGYHKRAGEFHAERMALTGIQLTAEQQNTSTLYVTLEPCCTHGKTPPCTEIILEKGIKRVVVGAIDPNPAHLARGIELLRQQGVEVITGVLSQECAELNPIFHHRMQTGRPLIALKTAATLDGKIATITGHSKWITGLEARSDVMRWRKYFPAIAVGAGTVTADNPSLTIRHNDQVMGCPIRLIFDRSLCTRDSIDALAVFKDSWKSRTWLITSDEIAEDRLSVYRNRGIQILQLSFTNYRFPLQQFHDFCMQRGLWGVYMEGGRSLVRSFLEVKGIDYLFCYHAPKIFGTQEAPGFADGLTINQPDQAPEIEQPTYKILGRDLLTRGSLVYPAY